MEFPPKNPQEATHQAVMREICYSLADTPIVLKGGTALLLCYGLDRPSEDLDFDSSKKMGLERRIDEALARRFRIDELKTLKDTDTVQRLRLNYTDLRSGIHGRLKIETSFRQPLPDSDKHVVIEKKIRVYDLHQLFIQKTVAFYERTAARDAYDLSFILGKTWFRPELKSLERLSKDFENPQRFGELEKLFRPAFQTDPLLAARDFDKVMLDLSERIQNAVQRLKSPSLHIAEKPLQNPRQGMSF